MYYELFLNLIYSKFIGNVKISSFSPLFSSIVIKLTKRKMLKYLPISLKILSYSKYIKLCSQIGDLLKLFLWFDYHVANSGFQKRVKPFSNLSDMKICAVKKHAPLTYHNCQNVEWPKITLTTSYTRTTHFTT